MIPANTRVTVELTTDESYTGVLTSGYSGLDGEAVEILRNNKRWVFPARRILYVTEYDSH